jgi:hypothetical protein
MSKFHLNLLVQFSKVLPNSKNRLKFKTKFFLIFGPSPVFGPVAAHLPSPQRRPTYQLAQWPSAGPHGLPLFSLADVRAPPSSPSLGQAGRAPPSSAHRRASLGHCPSPVPWREADPPRPLPLPLLYWPPPPPPLPVTNAHLHQWCHLHFTVARSPPSPSAPIKGAPAAPHLAAPHTTLLSSSLKPELTPTVRLQSPPLCRRHPIASPPLRLR